MIQLSIREWQHIKDIIALTLLRLVEDWKSVVERKELVYILTTDMSKAFDSLFHSLIVEKLEDYGFGQNSFNLLRSYFDNRLNRTKNKRRDKWLEKDGTWLSARLFFRSPSVEFVPKWHVISYE